MNGILKQEYALGLDFPDPEAGLRAISTAVRLYNDERPHGSLQNSTPSRVFSERFSAVAEHALLQLKICS